MIKSSSRKELIADQKTYISADDIAYELAPNNPESVHVQAGKEFFKRLKSAITNDENVLIESTLIGETHSSLIENYQREHEYSVTIVFVYLANADVCVDHFRLLDLLQILFKRFNRILLLITH
jgi:predicted ABC-type ATPase